MQGYLRRNYRIIIFALMLALLSTTPFIDGWIARAAPGPGVTDAPSWDCADQPASVGFKEYPWSNSTGGVGSGLPAPALVQVGNDFARRQWDVWVYPPGVTYHYRWEGAVVEDTQPGGLPTGRINPTGNPTVYYHDGWVKLLFVQWPGDGGGAGALYRARLPCHYDP